jgi:hypothetical protein
MRLTLLPFLLLTTLAAHAQCCCADHEVELHTPDIAHDGDRWNYMVDLAGDHTSYGHPDSVPGDPYKLRLRVPTDCGLESVTWTVRQRSTGGVMRIRLDDLPGDVYLPTLRLAFSVDGLYFNIADLLGCIHDSGHMRDEGTIDTIACTGSEAVFRYRYDAQQSLEPLDLQPYRLRPPDLAPLLGPVAYIGGEAGFQAYLHAAFSKEVIERAGITATLTGTATVERDGTIRKVDINGDPNTPLSRELVRVVRASPRWKPEVEAYEAVVRGQGATYRPSHRALPARIPIRFDVDPAAIWSELPESILTVLPAAPTSRDPISLTFHWIGGSCGRYADSVQVRPMDPVTGRIPIAVGFGLMGEICCDIRDQHHTMKLPPLAPGRYRLSIGAPPKGLIPVLRGDPYIVRDFEVR